MGETSKRTDSGTCQLPNGCTLYWQRNEVGGRNYSSDDIGGGVFVWDTALVDHGTLLMAMAVERELEMTESREEKSKPSDPRLLPYVAKTVVNPFS